jgi:DNA-binding YbaB/EbfC family protein
MFQGLGNLASILMQAQKVGGKLRDMTAELRTRRATGSSGGGLVEVEVNGLGEVLRVRLDPGLLARQDHELVEDLLPAAVNDALAKARQLHFEAMKGMTEGLELPGLDAALARITGLSAADGQGPEAK